MRTNDLFVDQFNIISTDLEANIVQILTHKKRTSEKVQNLTIELLNYKCQILKIISNLLKSQTPQSIKETKEMINSRILSEMKQNETKLYKHRLHIIIKNKLKRIKKDSLIKSYADEQEDGVSQLEKSMIMIQKDLGIQNEPMEMSRLGISSIATISMQMETPTRSNKQDISIISEMPSLASEIRLINQETDLGDTFLKENHQKNQKYIEQPVKTETHIKKPLIPTKKKRSIYSKNETKDKLLGNLLEETYNVYLDNK